MRLAYILVPLTLVSWTSAQGTVVSPKHFESSEGPSQNRFPFADATTFRFIQIHDDLQGSSLRLIRQMSFRRMGSASFNNNDFLKPYPKYSVTLDMWVSTAKTTATSPSTNFDNNHGNDKKQVLTKATINFPASVHAFVPNDFDYKIPFAVPFVYAATGPFCWEVQLTNHTATGSQYYDHAASTGTNPALAVSKFGTGCKLNANTAAMDATGSSSMNWPNGTGTLTVTGKNGPPNGLVIFILGASSTSFGALPLPFLLPGSNTAPSGPCNLYTDILLAMGSPTNASGNSTTSLPVPATAAFNGLRTFEQLLALSTGANPLGLVSSNGVNHNWVSPITSVPVARVWRSGSLAATGTADRNYGHVIKFN